MSQVIETIYKFVGGPAAAELARVQAAEDKLGASSSKMAQGLAAAERAMGVMQAGAKSLQQKLAPTASAIAGMTSALGEHNGAAGKAVAGVGQLAGAFAQGGPFGLALAGAVIGVQALTKSWDDAILAQDRAIASANAGASAAGAARGRVEAEIAALRSKLDGPETGAQASARVQAEIDAAKAQVADILVRRKDLERTMLGRDGYKEARDQLQSERMILEGVIRRLGVKQGLAFLVASQGNKGAGGGVVPPAGDGDVLDDWKARGLETAAEQQKQQQDLAQKRLDTALEEANRRAKAMEDLDASVFENERAAYVAQQEYLAGIDRQFAAQRAREAEGEAQAYARVIGDATATIAAGVVAGAQGQKDALAGVLSALAQQAGGAITLKGGEVLAEGIKNELILPGNPLGIAQIAGGVGLIAAGAAITTGGPAAVHALLGKASGGKGSGDSGARVSAGPARRPHRDNGRTGAATTVVNNITYGGPLGRVAEEVARDTVKANETAARRGHRR